MSYRGLGSNARRTALGWTVFAAGLLLGPGCSDDDSIPELQYNTADGGGSSQGATSDTRSSDENASSAPTDESSSKSTEESSATGSPSDTATTSETPSDTTGVTDTSAAGTENSTTSSGTSLATDGTGGLGSNTSEDTSAATSTTAGASLDTLSTMGSDGTLSSAGNMSSDPSMLTDAGPDASEESTGATSDLPVDTYTDGVSETLGTGIVLPTGTSNDTSTGGGGLPTLIGDMSDAGDAGSDAGMDADSDGDAGMDGSMDTSTQSSMPASSSEMNSTSADACMCSNGIQDGDETGIDCGGCCGGCPGSACAGPEDCASGLCPNDVCITPAGEAPPAPSGALSDFVRYQVAGNYVNLPVTLESSASVEFGNKVFILGGRVNGSTSDAIYEATVGNDGFFESFTLNASYQLATARYAHRAEIIGGYVYVFGGRNPLGQTLTSVERAPLGTSGIAGPFETVSGVTLSTARYYFTTVTTPGYVYAIGGNFPQLNTMERAPVDQNGDITSTFTALTRVDLGGSAQDGLNVGRWTLGVARIGQDVYFVGGEQLSSIERSTIQNDGSLGVLTFANPLPSNRNRVSLAILADTIYAFGGWAGSFLSTVESAPIVAGEIGTWSTTSITLENPVENGTPLRTNAAVYLFGGNAGGATNYIQRAIIQQ